VTSKFTITLRRNNKLAEELQKISNKHRCFWLTLSLRRLTF